MQKKHEITTVEELSNRLYDLHMQRKNSKQKIKRKTLTKKQRALVLQKTASKCHICGGEVTIDKFQADHVESHCRGGSSVEDNYLPSCFTCNNYRWHYLPEELHWILKLGVFTRSFIEKQTSLGKQIGQSFIKHELRRQHNQFARKEKSGGNKVTTRDL